MFGASRVGRGRPLLLAYSLAMSVWLMVALVCVGVELSAPPAFAQEQRAPEPNRAITSIRGGLYRVRHEAR